MPAHLLGGTEIQSQNSLCKGVWEIEWPACRWGRERRPGRLSPQRLAARPTVSITARTGWCQKRRQPCFPPCCGPTGADQTCEPGGRRGAWEGHTSWGPGVIDRGLPAEVWTLGRGESSSVGVSGRTKAKPAFTVKIPGKGPLISVALVASQGEAKLPGKYS